MHYRGQYGFMHFAPPKKESKMRTEEAIQREGTVSRVVEVVDSTPNSEQVRIRNLFEPIFIGMWQFSKDTLQAYHTDLCHDALMLGNSKVGDKFLWGYRDSGTTLLRIRETWRAETVIKTAVLTNPLKSYHLVEITKFRENHADGYLTWINAQDEEHLKRVVLDNCTD